jgi:hypothetical protein
MKTTTATELYDSEIAAVGRARQADLYEVAFHALSAALHCAEALGDIDRVRYVTQQATEIHDWLTHNHPHHPLGAHSAHLRGQTDVFSTLIVHAQSMTTRLRAVSVVERARTRSALARQVTAPPPDADDV